MAKFCGKCGSKLDEVTGLCPNCDAEQIKKQIEQSAEQPKPAMKNDKLVQQQELSLSKKEAKKKCKAEKKATKKVKKKEKWAEKTLGQKLKSMLFKTIIWILLVCFLFVFIVGLLTYYGILEIPILDKVMDKVGIEVGTQNVERTTPETNTMDFSLYPSSEKNIIVDKQSGFVYFNNEILVTLVSKNEKANLEIYLESIGGHVVGEIPEIAEYQILLDEEYTYNQLMEYVDIMEGFDWVISASPNYALKMDASYIPNDREWKSKWGDFPEGINWGVEAIDADEAWEYQNEMERVNVGVIDTMFDLNHEDLVFAEKPLGTEGIKAQMSEGKRDWDNHGSHTAGTIAASFDNKKGIAGVSPTSNLYGVSIWGIEASGYSSLQAWKISLYYLIAVNNCKAEQLSDFSVNKNHLRQIVTGISDGGGTNIGDGLAKAKSMLDKSQAKKKMIVLMSDGEPNQGKEGEELIAYANELKNSGIYLYTLGFFEDMGDKKSSAQYLMEEIASDGCHYEVANADDLVFFFEDIADQINGQKYIYVRIACPVDVSVTYKGETLNSSEKNPALRTKFGTLTFEENQSTSSQGEEDKVKILRLKEGADYDIQIEGTGYGVMDYTIGFMDENGEYSDFRKFENIKITKQTMIDTVAADSDESVLTENGLAAVQKGDNIWSYIDATGKEVISLPEEIMEANYFVKVE